MIVASDTSPLTSLAAVGHFELLRTLYREIHIAEGVWQELNHGGRRHPGSHEVEKAPWVYRHEVRNQALVAVLRRDLDRVKQRLLLWRSSSRPTSFSSMRKKAVTPPVVLAFIRWEL